MPHGRAHENLEINESGGGRRNTAQPAVVDASPTFNPARRREQRNRHGHAEKDFGERRVCRRNCRWKKEEHRETAEQALSDNGSECRESQLSHPAARILPPQPGGQDNREKADRGCDEPMAVFVENPTNPLRRWKREHVPPVARWPVGNRQTRARAGDQAACENKQHRAAGYENREAVKHPFGRSGRSGRSARPVGPAEWDLPRPIRPFGPADGLASSWAPPT